MARRLPHLSRGSLALVLNALLGLLALGLAFAPAGEGAPQLRLAAATGSLTLVNSKEGTAIFRADAMRPDQPATGSVTITNTGSVNAALTLQPEGASDVAGAGGGKLSAKLDLEVVDVTLSAAPVTVYEGTLKQMEPTDVGSLAPGASRTYRFAATLKGSGIADNAFQGAALTTGFRWNATGLESPTPEPTSTPTPTPTATPAPVSTAAPSDGGSAPLPEPAPPAVTPPPADPAAADPTGELLGAQLFALPAATRKCVSRRRFAIHVRRPSGMTFSSIAISVNGRTKVRLKGLKAKKVKATINLKGLPAGKVTVKITALTSTGRKAVSKRTYTTCAKRKR
jgi:spore coat-associated protein N